MIKQDHFPERKCQSKPVCFHHRGNMFPQKQASLSQVSHYRAGVIPAVMIEHISVSFLYMRASCVVTVLRSPHLWFYYMFTVNRKKQAVCLRGLLWSCPFQRSGNLDLSHWCFLVFDSCFLVLVTPSLLPVFTVWSFQRCVSGLRLVYSLSFPRIFLPSFLSVFTVPSP